MRVGKGEASRTQARRARELKCFLVEARSWKMGERLLIGMSRSTRNGNLQLQLLPRQSWFIQKTLALLLTDIWQGRLSDTSHPLMWWGKQGQVYELTSHGRVQTSANLPGQEGRGSGLLKVYNFFQNIKHISDDWLEQELKGHISLG